MTRLVWAAATEANTLNELCDATGSNSVVRFTTAVSALLAGGGMRAPRVFGLLFFARCSSGRGVGPTKAVSYCSARRFTEGNTYIFKSNEVCSRLPF